MGYALLFQERDEKKKTAVTTSDHSAKFIELKPKYQTNTIFSSYNHAWRITRGHRQNHKRLLPINLAQINLIQTETKMEEGKDGVEANAEEWSRRPRGKFAVEINDSAQVMVLGYMARHLQHIRPIQDAAGAYDRAAYAMQGPTDALKFPNEVHIYADGGGGLSTSPSSTSSSSSVARDQSR